MITVEEANDIIQSHSRDFGTETVPLVQAMGRVLREEIKADRDFPPYDRVTMDGIAIQYSQYEGGQRGFPVAGVAAAGAEKQQLSDPSQCLEVMTGAIMPSGVDTVIPYEKTETTGGIAKITVEDIRAQQNVHSQGFDRKQGEVIFPAGRTLSAAEIGVCATVGKSQIKVSRLPKAIVISSGDELVDIDETPLAHQIRRSNVLNLQTVLEHYQAEVITAHLSDDFDMIVGQLRSYVEEYDLIILSGGVSKGKFDYLPKALEEVGVQKHFHKVKQRPGKPFWFGTYGDKAVVFAFPGNPVSSFMCMQQYFRPWLDKSLMLEPKALSKAKLASDVHFKPDLTYFLEVRLTTSDEGDLLAVPVKGNGSGDLANLVDADAFVILPRGRDSFHEGEAFPFITYRERVL
jgi:molybdopterin molybdotransferase